MKKETQDEFFKDPLIQEIEKQDLLRQERLRTLVHGMRGEGELKGYRLIKRTQFEGGYWVTEATYKKLFDKQP